MHSRHSLKDEEESGLPAGRALSATGRVKVGKTCDHRIYSDGGGQVVVGAGMGTARAHQAVRLAAEVTHGLGQMLENMQLEEEQEANVGGEGGAALLVYPGPAGRSIRKCRRLSP